MNSKLVALILIIAVSLSMLSCQKEMSDYEDRMDKRIKRKNLEISKSSSLVY